MLSDLFAVIAPVFLTALVGYLWVKSGRDFDVKQLTPLIITVGTPCLVVSTLLTADLDVMALGQIAGAAVLAHSLAAAIGWVLLRAAKLPITSYLPALAFPNTGNMGLPLCLFAFGEKGLALAIGYFVVSAIGQFTLGYAISAGHMDLKRLVRTPIIWAVAIAVALLMTDTSLPRWAMNTLGLIGQFNIPLMLLALGVSLAGLSVKRLGVPLILSCLRIAGGAGLGFAIAWGLDLEGIARGVVILQTVMPVAVFNYLFAQVHGNRPEEVAGLVVVSTGLSFATLPLLLAFLL
jgi:hypothetical protein